MFERVAEIQRDLGKIKSALAIISATPNEEELRDAWEQYLIFWRRCLDKMVAGAMKPPAHRPWAHRLKNMYLEAADEGVAYLWEARNVEDHGVGAFAPMWPAYTELGGGIIVTGDTEVEERANLMISREGYSLSGNRRTVTRRGVATSVSGDNPEDVVSIGARAILVPIYSEAKGKTFLIPATIAGVPIPGGNAASLAGLGHAFLLNIFQEYLDRAAGKI